MQVHPVANYGASIPALQQKYTLAIGGRALPLAGMVKVDKDGAVEFVHDGSEPEVMQARINALGKAILTLPEAHNDLPVEHEFADGMYIRRMFIPKHTFLIGKLHKRPCVNVVERGDIAIFTATGAMRVRAGFTLVSPAGIAKVGFANEDTVFTNIFRTDETDTSKIEDVVAWQSLEAMQAALEGGIVCQQDG